MSLTATLEAALRAAELEEGSHWHHRLPGVSPRGLIARDPMAGTDMSTACLRQRSSAAMHPLWPIPSRFRTSRMSAIPWPRTKATESLPPLAPHMAPAVAHPIIAKDCHSATTLSGRPKGANATTSHPIAPRALGAISTRGRDVSPPWSTSTTAQWATTIRNGPSTVGRTP